RDLFRPFPVEPWLNTIVGNGPSLGGLAATISSRTPASADGIRNFSSFIGPTAGNVCLRRKYHFDQASGMELAKGIGRGDEDCGAAGSVIDWALLLFRTLAAPTIATICPRSRSTERDRIVWS